MIIIYPEEYINRLREVMDSVCNQIDVYLKVNKEIRIISK